MILASYLALNVKARYPSMSADEFAVAFFDYTLDEVARDRVADRLRPTDPR